MRTLDVISFAAVIACAGCLGTGGEEATRNATPEERIRGFEARFTPSAEDRVGRQQPGETTSTVPRQGESPLPAPAPSEPTEEVSGFRIQLFSTNDIDEAGVKKGEAESLFPGEWVYLQYDQPTYKIRVGNFLRRFDAERFRTQAIERGFAGAWIVPSRVVKNPPPPPKRPPAEPQLQ